MLRLDWLCGLLASPNIPATSNSFPAEDHARNRNKQVFEDEDSSAERRIKLNTKL